MAFVIYADPGVRFYHYGDTALFSDMKLQAELYRPTVGCVGIANPEEILHRYPMPGRMVTAEMSPREGAMAAQWLGLETVFPCHYINPDCTEVQEFNSCLAEAHRQGRKVPESVVLKPGEIYWAEPKDNGPHRVGLSFKLDCSPANRFNGVPLNEPVGELVGCVRYLNAPQRGQVPLVMGRCVGKRDAPYIFLIHITPRAKRCWSLL